MSQNDFTIANQGFPAFRADLNSALQALASLSAGATEPSTTFAYQLWYDSTNNLLKMRNTDNDAWITLAYLDQTNDEWEVRSAVIQAVDAAGVVIKTDDGTTRLTIADSGAITTQGNLTVGANLDVSSGTIKLDGNYPVGTNNVALGDTALDDASLTGGNNTAIGANALTANTTGASNTAVGYQALWSNTTASYNNAFGHNALVFNTTGANNVAVGNGALQSNTTASNNTAVGYQALLANTTGVSNTAIGFGALDANTTAGSNVAIGDSALGASTTGASNVGIGHRAGDAITTGSSNVTVGKDGLGANTTGSSNVALGASAMVTNQTGSNNIGVGYRVMNNMNGGTKNTVVGNDAGYSFTTGSYNVCIGSDAGGQITTGSKNTIIGSYNGNQDGLDIRTASNRMVISDGDGNIGMYIDGSQDAHFDGDVIAYSTTISDRRLKGDIENITDALDKVGQINGVTFVRKNNGEASAGIIAQEIMEVLPEAVKEKSMPLHTGSEDTYYVVEYDAVTGLLVEAVKELKARVEALEAK